MRSISTTSPFGRRLRAARLRVGIPQDKLGVLIGIDESSASARISRYESGVHAPQYEIAAKLASALNIPTAYLFCDDDNLAPLILAWEQLSEDAKKSVMAFVGVERANSRQDAHPER